MGLTLQVVRDHLVEEAAVYLLVGLAEHVSTDQRHVKLLEYLFQLGVAIPFLRIGNQDELYPSWQLVNMEFILRSAIVPECLQRFR